jgi:FkbM family methyltransferase
MKLSIVLATRKRPGMLARTVEETLKHIKLKDSKLLIAVDDDDDGTISLQDVIKDKRVIWSIKPREDSLGEKFNRVIKEAPADVYMVMVDYAPCVTDNFDGLILDAAKVYPDGYAVILNHLANLSFSQLNAVTHKLVEKMGGIYPAIFPYWFVDHWLEDLAKQIARQVFVDVWMDCTRRPGTMDKLEPALWGNVFDWLYLDRRNLARKIINSPDFDETPARKKALLRNHELVEEWSRIINTSLQREAQGDIDPNDERYARIRQRAIDLVQPIIDAHNQEQKTGNDTPTGLHIRNERVEGIGPWLWVAGDVWGWKQPKEEFPALRDLILSNVKDRRSIVQAGGCCGMYPRLWAESFETVTTFEPDPLNFQCLTANCPDPRITKHQAALSSKPFFCSIERTSGDFNVGMHRIGSKPGDIPVKRLDDFKFKHLDALQLDCEGHEPEIIAGAKRTIMRHHPLISIEAPNTKLVEKLKSWGYTEAGRCGSNPDVVFVHNKERRAA